MLYGCTTWTLNGWRKCLTATPQECYEQYWTGPGGKTPQNCSYTATNHPSPNLSKLDEPDRQGTAREVGTSSLVMYSYGPLHKQGDHLKPIYRSSVRIRGVALRICRKRWTIGRGGKKGSGISVPMARQDDNDEMLHLTCIVPSLKKHNYYPCYINVGSGDVFKNIPNGNMVLFSTNSFNINIFYQNKHKQEAPSKDLFKNLGMKQYMCVMGTIKQRQFYRFSHYSYGRN